MESQQADKLKKAAGLLRGIAHPVRIEIIRLLSDQPSLSVGDLQQQLGISQSMTSQHLAALRQAQVVQDRKEGNVRYYYLKKKEVLKLLDCLQRCCWMEP